MTDIFLQPTNDLTSPPKLSEDKYVDCVKDTKLVSKVHNFVIINQIARWHSRGPSMKFNYI